MGRGMLAAAVAVLLLGNAGCSGHPVTVPFGPVSFHVAGDGQVSVTVGPTFVTPLGEFKVGVTAQLGDLTSEYWYVAIRRTVEGEGREVLFQLDTKAGLRIESNGQVVEEYTQHRVLIEVPAGSAATIEITKIGSGEVNTDGDSVYLVPREFMGIWKGAVTGGDRELFYNAPNVYWPSSAVRLHIYGGEIGNVVGEFHYPAWTCSGVLKFNYAGPDFADKRMRVHVANIVQESGSTQRCGGFIKRGMGYPDEGGLTLRLEDGVLLVDTELKKSPQEEGKPVAIVMRLTRA